MSEHAIPRRLSVVAGFLCCLAIAVVVPATASAQDAELSGVIRDEQGGGVAHGKVSLTSEATGVVLETASNERGVYVFVAVRPAAYILRIEANGFSPVNRPGIILNVGQRSSMDFTLSVAGRAETVEVGARTAMLANTDGSVGTVIDRKFVANLPLNGRTFDSLISLAPGVARVPTTLDGGSFAVNGQRASSNYYTVDGVAAVPSTGADDPRNSAAGQLPATTVTGGLNAGVSMEALQEFRIQTSTFSPEFGRTPGAQVSLVTRSGANALRGSVFEQFRDDSVAANGWFANSRNEAKPSFSMHQFGGALGGPVLRNRTFFFGVYEGLRFEEPRSVTGNVPTLEARRQPSPIQQMLTLYPEPNGQIAADGLTGQYGRTDVSNTESDSWSLRLDHSLGPRLQLFGRYSYEPGSQSAMGLMQAIDSESAKKNVTAGMTAVLGSHGFFDARANYTNSESTQINRGGIGEQIRSLFDPFLPADTELVMQFTGMSGIDQRHVAVRGQPQTNFVASFSYLFGAHHFKAGVDHRRMEARGEPTRYASIVVGTVAQGIAGNINSITIRRSFELEGVFHNVSVYLQDAWKVADRLSMTYGLRWDVSPAPSFAAGQGPLAATITGNTGRDISLSPERNVPGWKTRYDDISPRVGFSYALDSSARTSLSGGVGLFNDLAGAASAIQFEASAIPNSATLPRTNLRFPLQPSYFIGLETPVTTPPFSGVGYVTDPTLRSPRTTQWNLTLERQLGAAQAVSVAYVGARGSRLTDLVLFSPSGNPDFPQGVGVIEDQGRSRYGSLQLQYRRRAAQGLQLLSAYTLSESRDTESATFHTSQGHDLTPSSYDVRHNFKLAASWDLPDVAAGPLSWALRDWGLHAIATTRSGLPFSVQTSTVTVPGEERLNRRASLVPGVPIIVDDPTAPGGQRYNLAAFTTPPTGQQGDTSRNQFRAFAHYQVDMGIQRTVRLTQAYRAQIRVDAFNLFNTPGFGLPGNFITLTPFGIPVNTLNGNSSYAPGAPRIIEFALRFEF